MAARRIEITVSDEVWDRLNDARGHEPRASFVKRALEKALGEPQAGAALAHDRVGSRTSSEAPSPAPSRAPAKKTEIALEVRDAVRARGVDPAVAARQAKLNAARYRK